MGNVKSVSEKLKNFRPFIDGNRLKKIAKSIKTRRSTECWSVDKFKTISISKLIVGTVLKNITFVLQKIRKMKFVSLING